MIMVENKLAGTVLRDDPHVVALVTRRPGMTRTRGKSLSTAMRHWCIQSVPGTG